MIGGCGARAVSRKTPIYFITDDDDGDVDDGDDDEEEKKSRVMSDASATVL